MGYKKIFAPNGKSAAKVKKKTETHKLFAVVALVRFFDSGAFFTPNERAG